jgi:hypothetical protein
MQGGVFVFLYMIAPAALGGWPGETLAVPAFSLLPSPPITPLHVGVGSR